MRWDHLALIVMLSFGSGCGASDASTGKSTETPEQAATRVFAIARSLEGEKRLKEAFAVYRQVVTKFPETAEAKLALKRIRLGQAPARRKRPTNRRR